MVTLSLFGIKFTVNDGRELYNNTRAIFYNKANYALKKLKSTYCVENIDEVKFNEFRNEGNELEDQAIKILINQLVDKGIYEYSIQTIKRRENYRCHDINCSAVNFFNINFYIDSKRFEAICNNLYLNILSLTDIYMDILNQEKDEEFFSFTRENRLKSEDLFSNITTGIYQGKPEVEKQMWIKLLETYPYNPDYFVFLFEKYENSFEEIYDLVKWYNLSIVDIADKILSKKYDFSNISNLEQLDKIKDDIIRDLNKFKLTYSYLLDQVEETRLKVLTDRRTYNNYLYDTEEDCDYARKLDLNYQRLIENSKNETLENIIYLYLDILDGANSEKFFEICKKNAISMQNSMVSIIQTCTETKILVLCQNRLSESKNFQINNRLINTISETLTRKKTYEKHLYATIEECDYAKKLDLHFHTLIQSAQNEPITNLIYLYLEILDGSDSEKFPEISQKNANSMQYKIRSIIRSCNDAKSLMMCKSWLYASKNVNKNQNFIREIDLRLYGCKGFLGLGKTKGLLG